MFRWDRKVVSVGEGWWVHVGGGGGGVQLGLWGVFRGVQWGWGGGFSGGGTSGFRCGGGGRVVSGVGVGCSVVGGGCSGGGGGVSVWCGVRVAKGQTLGALKGSKGANVSEELNGIFLQFEFRFRNGLGLHSLCKISAKTRLIIVEILANFCTTRETKIKWKKIHLNVISYLL